jgi:predicted transcriptional regulator
MTTTTEKKIKLSQLIQLVLILSDKKKGMAADLMQVSQPTFSNWIHSNKSTRLGRIKGLFKACEIPFLISFNNEIIEDFNYFEFSRLNPAKFEKKHKAHSSFFNICKHFEALGEEMNFVIYGTKYIIEH